MRRLVLAVVMLGAMSDAQAADWSDLPILRGTQGLTTARVNWQGYYLGGQAGYGSSDEAFSGSNSAMTAGMLANTLIEAEMAVSSWPLEFKRQSKHVNGFGAFAGYNSQWDDVVIGLEASYLHGKFGGASSGTMSRYSLLSDGDYHSVTSSAASSIAIKDIATLRMRAGYAWGAFLPYLFGGLALGHADIVRTAFAQDFVTAGPGSTTPANLLGARQPHNAVVGQYGHLIYGYSAGLGFDMNLVGGLFLRGEWEYIRFTSAIDTTINTVRGGIGYKF